MAFPENILTDGEQVAMHLHPHWREMIRPVLILLLGIGVIVVNFPGLLWMPDSDGGQLGFYIVGGVVLVLLAWLTLWPWMVWRTRHYIFTNERVVLQYGIFRRERRDIPLQRVNNHTMNQTLADRMFGCGTLVIESAGSDGTTELLDVPKVSRVQTLLYELVDADRDKHSLGDGEFREIMEELKDGSSGNA